MNDMKFVKADMALREALRLIRPEADYRAKNMFGGVGYYINERMAGAHYGGSLALKLSEADRAALLVVPGSVQAQSPQYVEVPESFLDDPQLLAPWLEKCLSYIETLPQKKKKGK